MDDAESLPVGRGSQADDCMGTASFPGVGPADFVTLRLQDSTAVRLIDLAPQEAAARFARLLATPVRGNDGPVTVAFMNMRNFIAVQKTPEALGAFAAMDQLFPDGVGLQLGRLLAGLPRFSRVSGTDTIPLLLARMPRGTRVFLLGGSRTLSAAAAARLPELFPSAVLAGAHHGFFGADEDEAVLAAIVAAAPDVLLIGMGSPLQEQWLARHRDRLPARLAICVGGLFHYWTRDLHRAPRSLREAGLEWLWILAQQPFKWRVYTFDAARFGAILMHRRRAVSS